MIYYLMRFYTKRPGLIIRFAGAGILSFLLVGVASSSDRKRDTAAMIIFALVFVAVLIVIVDLDRPQEGLLRVPQTAMTDLLRQITLPG